MALIIMLVDSATHSILLGRDRKWTKFWQNVLIIKLSSSCFLTRFSPDFHVIFAKIYCKIVNDLLQNSFEPIVAGYVDKTILAKQLCRIDSKTTDSLMKTTKSPLSTTTDYGHTMAKSLILCGPNWNPNPKKYGALGIKAYFFVEIIVD